MFSTSTDNTEDVEVQINNELQQSNAAELTSKTLLSHQPDHRRLQAAAGACQMNASDPLLMVIDRGVRKIISFARKVPGFDTLIVADQICLVKRQFAIVYHLAQARV